MRNELLDKDRVAAIAARATDATRGPWKPMLEGRDHTSGSSCILTAISGIDLDGASDADIEFMAHAREDVPYLISELLRLSGMLTSAHKGES